MGMFVIKDGIITGSDFLGVLFDGSYEINTSASMITGVVKVRVPPNASLINGITAGDEGLTYETPINFPINFTELPYITLQSPFGATNVKLVKIRGFE